MRNTLPLLKHCSRLIVLILLLSICGFSQTYGQNSLINFTTNSSLNVLPEVSRKIQDYGLKGINATYQFPGASVSNKLEQQINFQFYTIKDFSHLKTVGRPALPVHYDLVLIPEDATPQIDFQSSETKIIPNQCVYPALKPATDREGDPEPSFEIDEAFYQSDVNYPDAPVKIIATLRLKGLRLALIQVCPLQYNPAQRKITVFSKLSYTISFTGATSFFNHADLSSAFLSKLPNLVLNQQSVSEAAKNYSQKKNVIGPAADYIIITHQNYLQAADSLAKWKSQLGYRCEIVSASSWTSSQVKAAIQQRYQSWSPKPDYFVILGDHDLVPGEIHQDPVYGDNFATDLYYACMDGAGDDVADMAFGRISVSSATEAMSVVTKIINYEKNPPSTAAFYTSGTVCAQFQDDDSNSYEDRRFALTAEELRDYMNNEQGFTTDRVYTTDADVTPLYWNNDYYAAGEPVPAYLQKPGFAWDGDRYDIRDALNSPSGRLFIAHRDHGYVGGSGWASPRFTTTDINMLNNGNLTPVVFSINCHTGEYQLPECFSEKFLRYTNGGAVGVFGAAYYSYSGYNDGLILGMFDAIWSNPGILPDFTGYADSPIGTPTPHTDIYTMGDVLNQGMMRMIQTWGDDSYTHELFHYFGDPAMQIWTALPTAITATHSDTLFCRDSVFNIFSSSLPNALATLVVDGELVAETSLSSGVGTLTFTPFAGAHAVLSLSGHNYRPYIYSIPIQGNCVKADFNITDNGLCVDHPIDIASASTGSVTTYAWNFGSGAVPATANTTGPHQIFYTTPGTKTITLTVTGPDGSNSHSETLDIIQVCSYSMISNATSSYNDCSGILYDAGGLQNYPNNTNDTVLITASGAASLQLMFNDFDVEPGSASSCDYDVIKIFDGNSVLSPLLGSWCNTAANTPPAALTTSGNSFTVVFHSDLYTNMRGFELEWACTQSGSAPVSMFNASPLSSCNGEITFSDHSTNNPTSWLWDFGDGNTSTQQNPTHTYLQNGLFNVSLSATNAYGTDVYSHLEYINIDRPLAPLCDSAMICNSGSVQLNASGSGNIRWYDAPFGGNLVGTGNSFTTPTLSATTTYYPDDQIEEIHYVGPSDSALTVGAFYTGSANHYLRFDALQDITLRSVKVYAQTNTNRKIRLRNSSGIILQDTNVAIGAGMQRINLNFYIPAGSGYRLECDSICRLYRNAAGASFPYTVPGVISITGNSYTNQSYYYYFYDWEIQMNACTSPRSPATVFVHSNPPSALFSQTVNMTTFNFTDLSTDAASWNWNFDDGTYSSLQNPQHTYTSNGTYHVVLSVTNACGTDNFSDTLYIYSVGTDLSSDGSQIQILPNPANHEATIIWPSLTDDPITINIYDVTGRLIENFQPTVTDRRLRIMLNDFENGLYIIEMNIGKASQQLKLLKY